MLYRRLGCSDLEVSAVGLGCNSFGRTAAPGEVDRIVGAALETGVTLFDTAESYGDGESERLLGRALGERRARALIATKFCAPGGPVDGAALAPSGSRAYVGYAVERSLRRLGTDWIDLYQLHWPDPATPVEETLEALSALIRAGKIRAYGLSNCDPGQLQAALAAAAGLGLPPPAALQIRWNLLERQVEADLVPLCGAHGVGVLPYFPLAAGLLAKAPQEGSGPQFAALRESTHVGRLADPATAVTLAALHRFAASRGRTLRELAVSWLLTRPATGSVIAGARTESQARSTAGCAGWALSAEDLDELDAITEAPGHSAL